MKWRELRKHMREQHGCQWDRSTNEQVLQGHTLLHSWNSRPQDFEHDLEDYDYRTPTTLNTEMVKGGDLHVGDKVVIVALVTEINADGHIICNTNRLPRPWNSGDQYIWTWGGKHGSGMDNEPDITKVV